MAMSSRPAANTAAKPRLAIYVNGAQQLGGAERRFFRLALHLRARDHDLQLATCEAGAIACEALGLPLDRDWTHIVPSTSRQGIATYPMLFRQVFSLVAWVRRKRITHLHFGHNTGAFTFLFSLLSPLACRFSVSVVDSGKDYQRSWRERLYSRVTARRAARIDCLSSRIKQELCAFLGVGYEHKCVVAPCSFTESRVIDVRRPRDVDIALISRMVPRKGHSLLCGALQELERAGMTGLVVHVCGGGPLQEQIRQEFAALKHQKVEFYYLQDPFELMQRCRTFVSLQDLENYPSQSLLEAMTCGCAIVATDVGLTRQLIDEECGVLVPRDSTALAAALRRLLEDDELRARLGAAARRKVTTEQTIERFADYLMDDVIAPGAR
jgi:glycosyltransferase involved in cell wall biosynthesis